MAGEKPKERERPKPGSTAAFDASTLDTEEADLEQYGVWVKAGPEDILENGEDFDLESLPPGDDAEASTLTAEEEELLGSLESGDDVAAASEEQSAPDGRALEELDEDFQFDLQEESAAPDDLPELGSAEEVLTIESAPAAGREESRRREAVDVTQPKSPKSFETIDDISAFEADLADSNEAKEESMAIPQGSESILQKIEKDLLSIKEELSSLKSEISGLRGSGFAPNAEEKKEKAAESGFFAEDEDETIALTGDELDNILNTADITEETGEPTVVPEENDLLLEEPRVEESADAGRLIDREDVIELDDEPKASRAETTKEELDLVEEEIAFDDLPESETESLDEIAIEIPESEPVAAEEELSDLPSDDSSLGVEDLTLDDEFKLSESEEESLAIEPEPLAASEPAVEELDEIDLSTPDLDDIDIEEPAPKPAAPQAAPAQGSKAPNGALPDDLKIEIKSILKYMDQLLESLPEDKIEEFARSEYFEVYKKLFDELGLTT